LQLFNYVNIVKNMKYDIENRRTLESSIKILSDKTLMDLNNSKIEYTNVNSNDEVLFFDWNYWTFVSKKAI